jgi:hypothetical protein
MKHLFITDFFLESALLTLSPKDLYMMRWINDDFRKNINYKHIKKSIAIRVEQKIKNDIKIPYDIFYNFLHKHNISICGSFLLQCVLDENFDDCMGIDLLINEDYTEILESFELIQHEYQMGQKYFYVHNKYFISHDRHIRFIIAHVPKSEFIQNMTSFDICKNLYDTRNIHISNLVGILNKKEKLKNVFVPGGLNKYAHFYTINALTKKYVSRGFRFKKLIIPNIYTKIAVIIVYTKTHFMFDENMYIINDKKVSHRGIDMHEIFDSMAQESGNFECDYDDCIYKTIYDMKHLHKYHTSALGGIYVVLIPYVRCKPLINFKKLEIY